MHSTVHTVYLCTMFEYLVICMKIYEANNGISCNVKQENEKRGKQHEKQVNNEEKAVREVNGKI